MLTIIQLPTPLSGSRAGQKPSNTELWMGAFGNMFMWGFITIIPPMLVSLVLTLMAPHFGESWEVIYEISVLISMYFMGVFSTYMFDKWRKTKLIPYIGKSKMK